MSKIRVILLGASNVQLSMPLLMENIQRLIPEKATQLELWTAIGHGRSYGRWSRVLFRELPGIVPCALWEDLRNSTFVPDQTYALVTDIGNDIPFHVPPADIVGWVTEVLRQLQEQRAKTIITGLPMGPVRGMYRWRYQILRSIFFPASRLSHGEVCDRMDAVNAQIQEVGAQFGATYIEPLAEWYGVDPIHPRISRRAVAWAHLLSGWNLFPNSPFFPASRLASQRVRRCLPKERRMFGHTQYANQPVIVHENQLQVSVY